MSEEKSTGSFLGADITLDHVSKDYGRGVYAVNDMDLKIEQGEFFSLLGSSGSGKSTTLKMLSGLEFPTKGHVYLGDEDITQVPANRRDIHTVFQNYALFPHMTVWDNVAYGPRGKKVPKAEVDARVNELLELVEMSEYKNVKPDALSGGQQQRIALARALVMRPKALLLDEPLGALDLKLRHHMQDVLRHIHNEVGITFVYVTHDQEEAFSMSDRVAVMDKGVLQQVAIPEELYAHPVSRFVADFVGSANIIDGTVAAVREPGLYEVAFPAFGTLVCPGVKGLAEGDAVCAVLRPQDIWLHGLADAEDKVRRKGTVVDRSFSGSFTRITFDTEGTQMTCLLTGNGNTGIGLTELDVAWLSRDMWIVPAE